MKKSLSRDLPEARTEWWVGNIRNEMMLGKYLYEVLRMS